MKIRVEVSDLNLRQRKFLAETVPVNRKPTAGIPHACTVFSLAPEDQAPQELHVELDLIELAVLLLRADVCTPTLAERAMAALSPDAFPEPRP